MRSALLDAPGILAQAEASTLGRGEQDLLVRFEKQLPGFGGLYISDGEVRVYMKSDAIPPAMVRAVLAKVYSAHGNPSVREAMVKVGSASIIRGQYALSELIAIQKRIEASIPNWTGAGTNIMANKVVVAFPDSDALFAGLRGMDAAGIPVGALTGIIMPQARTSASFTDNIRPVRDGLLMSMENDTYEPHGMKNINGVWVPEFYGVLCSIGFNVNTRYGDFFLTAAHCENEWRGQNGFVGDSVFQSSRYWNGSTWAGGFVGNIVVNPPWTVDSDCPINLNSGTHYDFCTDADVAMGQYTNGAYGDRRIAISQYGGINGNPGTNQINNWYPINAVLSPEYVDQTMNHQTGKSAGVTYTTSGPFVADMMDVPTTVCWPLNHNGCASPRTLLFQNHTVIQADVSGGDSGGAVFTGNPNNGAPYAALGILVARMGPAGLLPTQPCPTCRFVFSRWDKIEPHIGFGVLNPQTVF